MQYIFGEKMVSVKMKPENTTLINAEKFESLKNGIAENLKGITLKEYVYVSNEELEEVSDKIMRVKIALRKYFNLKEKDIQGGIGITSFKKIKTSETETETKDKKNKR